MTIVAYRIIFLRNSERKINLIDDEKSTVSPYTKSNECGTKEDLKGEINFEIDNHKWQS